MYKAKAHASLQSQILNVWYNMLTQLSQGDRSILQSQARCLRPFYHLLHEETHS